MQGHKPLLIQSDKNTEYLTDGTKSGASSIRLVVTSLAGIVPEGNIGWNKALLFTDNKMECGNQLETLPHVLYHCDSHAATRQLRHNRSAAASSLPSDQRVNQYVPDVDKDLAALRLDVVVTHESSRTVVIVDVTVSFENKFVAFEKARLKKILKYQPLAD